MRSSQEIKEIIVKGLLTVFISVSSKVYADAPAPKWYDTVAFSGYVQGSYVGNLSAPAVRTNVDRLYDADSNSFNMNAYHLQLSKPVGDDNYGFTTKLLFGRDAQKIHSAGMGGAGSANDFDLHEAYITYVVPALKKLSFVGGKFVTLEGLEVIEDPLNPNFSEGLLFVFGEPFTHTGLKATYTFNDKVNTTAGVVNGWDTAQDANDGKTAIWQVATTPCKYASWSFQGTYGPEALGTNQSKRTSLDTLLGLTPTDKLSIWLQGNWGQDTNLATAADANGKPITTPLGVGSSTAHWAGFGTWVQYAWNSTTTSALRYEVFSDENGANRLGNGVNETMKEMTVTQKFQLTKGVATRLEYRHDWSNQGVFNGHAPGSTGKDQNTISADWVVTF